MPDLIICDLRPDFRRNPRVSFWLPGGMGYTASLERAGVFTPEEVEADPERFSATERRQVIRFAVPLVVAMRMAEIAPSEGLECDRQPVVPNVADHRKTLRVLAWKRPEPRVQVDPMPSRRAALRRTAEMRAGVPV